MAVRFYVDNKMTRGTIKMDSIIHPISGEQGYFLSQSEKDIVDVVLTDFKNRHLVVTSADCRGGAYE